MFGGLIALISLVALVGAVSAFATGALSSAASVSVVAGKPTEFKFTVSKKTVPKGIVVFKVANRGRVTHDFRIAGKKTKILNPGQRTTLKVTLKKGTYAYLCTVPGHAALGMKGKVVVR